MNDYYNKNFSNVKQDIDWKEGKLCALLKKDDNNWYRGFIEEVLADDTVKV